MGYYCMLSGIKILSLPYKGNNLTGNKRLFADYL